VRLAIRCALGALVAFAPLRAQRGFGPGQRSLLDAHNCYPESGRWTDRIDRALSTGIPLAIEQDLFWKRDSVTGRFDIVVAHDKKALANAPTLESYFFEKVRPIMERALAEQRRDTWPLIVLNLDFKMNNRELHDAVYALLGKYEHWLTTTVRTNTPGIASPLRVGPMLVLSGADISQRVDFHDRIAVGAPLLVFGAIPVADGVGATDDARDAELTSRPATQLIESRASNYARWVNFPWLVVEAGGPTKAADWNTADSLRLASLVTRAHAQGLWIRFYTLDGWSNGGGDGLTRSYNFGSETAAKTRWAAAVNAGVDFVATDHYESFHETTARRTLTTSPPIELNDAALRLSFSSTDGHVVALRDWTNRQLAGVLADSVGLWALDIADGERITGIRAADATRFVSRRINPRTLEMTWSGFKRTSIPPLRVIATVQLRTDSTAAWRIRLEGTRGAHVERVHFPRLTGITTFAAREELAVPSWMGQRARNPLALLSNANGSSKRIEFAYPGATSMQVISLSNSAQGGLYFAADDSLAYRKSFALWGESESRAGYDMVHVLADPGTAKTYAPSYAALIGVVPGDWLTAVQRYRTWGTKQSWARQSRLRSGITPAWMRNTGIWEWNRGTSDVVLEPATLLQREAGLPVSVFWHWWHNGPYDTSFPDYLPPREGAAPFTAAVKKAHAEGLHAIVYMNQRLWCKNTPSWTREKAERWAVREHNGTVREETYNVFDPQPCATMDIATPFWRMKYAGIADTVIKQYGIDGIYMDQAVLSLIDWSKDHGHPVGGGNYWMQGFRTLARDLRARNAKRPAAFAGEGGGESWMPDLDAFLTLQVSQERYADPASGWEVIPMFQAAYHPYALTYGTYGSLTLPPYDELWPAAKRPPTAMTLLDEKFLRQFHLEQARMFVWGMQPTIANFLPNQLTERRREIDYLIKLAKLRHGLREYFQTGTFLRAPVVDVDSSDLLLSRISIYAARLGGPTEAHLQSPNVLSSAWMATNGSVAVALAGINLKPMTVTVHLSPAMYGLPPSTIVVRIDENGARPLGTLGATGRALKVDIDPLQAVVIELVPPKAQ